MYAKLTKCPNYVIIARKIFSGFFFWGGGRPPSAPCFPSPTPMTMSVQRTILIGMLTRNKALYYARSFVRDSRCHFSKRKSPICINLAQTYSAYVPNFNSLLTFQRSRSEFKVKTAMLKQQLPPVIARPWWHHHHHHHHHL